MLLNKNKGYAPRPPTKLSDKVTNLSVILSALNPYVTFLFYVALWPGIFVVSILILFLKENSFLLESLRPDTIK